MNKTDIIDKISSFDSISFKGKFRSYQAEILARASEYLNNDKIHVVAAPGSGKTILGLELIRRLGRPALILSPTLTIMTQWGDRLSDMFLEKGRRLSDFVSYNLKDTRLITSVTYQGFYSAYKRIKFKDESGEADEGDESAEIDYTGFDLASALVKAGIKTICLDEAHHLKNEWHKAITDTLATFGSRYGIKVIALTATPPYDSSQAEWNRYISLCGEIDAEIFVPELVKTGTLCPHQDYIHLSFPTAEEKAVISDFRQRALIATHEILHSNAFKAIIDDLVQRYENNVEQLLENAMEYAAILSLASYVGMQIPKKLQKIVMGSDGFLPFSLRVAEIAFQFVVDREDLFSLQAQSIHGRLKGQFLEQKKVVLRDNKRLSRLMVSSKGKLASISSIIAAESGGLGSNLRMVILTDFIKKEQKNQIGKDFIFDSISTVSILDAAIKSVQNPAIKIGVLSGGLVVMPDCLIAALKEKCKEMSVGVRVNKLADTDYSEILFASGNKSKVKVVTGIFEAGLLNILIGTASLLGEGWDSPCINSLILASSVSSFMLSNQMRGRAIRFDKNNVKKTANIWHLASIDGDYSDLAVQNERLLQKELNKNGAQIGLQSAQNQRLSKRQKNKAHVEAEFYAELESADYAMLKKRFDCFLGAAYDGCGIESGIARTQIEPPPFSENTANEINNRMITLSLDREGMRKKWEAQFDGSACEISRQEIIPKNAYLRPPVLSKSLATVVLVLFFVAVAAALIVYFAGVSVSEINVFVAIVLMGALIFLGFFAAKGTKKLLDTIVPKRFVGAVARAILTSLVELGQITSPKAKIRTETNAQSEVICYLTCATLHEKNVFNTALTELLSPPENPRYLIVKTIKNKPIYAFGYACPTVFGQTKQTATIVQKALTPTLGATTLIYTRTETGRRQIQKTRRNPTRPRIRTRTKAVK